MKKVLAAFLSFLLVLTVIPTVVSAAGDSIETATPINFNTQISGNITEENGVDFYKFTLPQSGNVVLSITAHIYKTHYRLYDSNGNEIWNKTYQTWNNVAQEYNGEFSIDLTSGDYYFSVCKYDGTGDYNFSVSYTTANESFTETTGGVDNSITDANTIELGKTYNGQLALNDGTDTYKFTLTESGKINLKLTAYIYQTHFYIYNSNGNEVWNSRYQRWNDTSKEYNKNDFIDLTSGDYYFSVTKYDGTGNYNFCISTVSANESFAETTGGVDNSITDANTIELGKTYNGQLALNDGTDTYKFTLTESGKINLKLTAYIYQTHFYIYNSNGNEVWNSRYQRWNDTSKEYNKNDFIDLTSGDYYFSVTKYDGTGNYNFSISFVSAEESFTETTGGINNSITDANAIELGTDYTGQIAINDSVDTYKFTLPTSGKINLKLTAYIYQTHFYIYNSNGNEVWNSRYQRWNDTSKEYNKNDFIDLTSGDYYFSVTKYDGTGNYNFSIGFVSSEESFTETTGGVDNGISTANPIELGTNYNGQLALNDGTDTYKFTLTESDEINLKLTAYIYQTHFYIYNSNGNEVWNARYQRWNETSKEYNMNEVINLDAGEYYFSVAKYDGTGNYNFSIAINENNVLLGDVNGDGSINSLDAAMILRHDATLITLEGDSLTAADVNCDGSVNSLDAAMVLRYDAGLISGF